VPTKCPPQLPRLSGRLAASVRREHCRMQFGADCYAAALLQPHSRPVRCKVTHHKYKHVCTTTCSASAYIPRLEHHRTWCQVVQPSGGRGRAKHDLEYGITLHHVRSTGIDPLSCYILQCAPQDTNYPTQAQGLNIQTTARSLSAEPLIARMVRSDVTARGYKTVTSQARWPRQMVGIHAQRV
jgi:hypothetical protein